MMFARSGILSHFTENPWNLVDTIGKLSMSIYFSINISRSGLEEADHENESEFLKTFETYLLVIGTMAQFMRAINTLKVIDKFRYLIKLLTVTLFDMIPFLTVLFLIIGMLGIVDNLVDKLHFFKN